MTAKRESVSGMGRLMCVSFSTISVRCVSLRELFCVALVAMLFGHGPSAGAQQLRQPTGSVVLTVSGDISNTNATGEAHFDLAMLESLSPATIHTTTKWTEGVQRFDGVLVREILRVVGANGETVLAFALNDYVVSFPVMEFSRYPVLAAIKMNGDYLRVRDKGPIWVVYPRDHHPELQNASSDHKWIWQLKRIHVK